MLTTKVKLYRQSIIDTIDFKESVQRFKIDLLKFEVNDKELLKVNLNFKSACFKKKLKFFLKSHYFL